MAWQPPPPQKDWQAPPAKQARQLPQQQPYGQPQPKQPVKLPPKQHGQSPPQQHGQPPQQQHGQPPTQKQDWQPPPRQQHGQPPQKQHGQPPQQQYGQLPQQQPYGQPVPPKQPVKPPTKQPPPQQQYGQPPPPQQQYGNAPPIQKQQYGQPPPPQKQYGNRGHQAQVSGQSPQPPQPYANRSHQAQVSGQINRQSSNTDDNKDAEAIKLRQKKQRTTLKNENIHFNFFDESQYGIANFPKTLSEIGILSSKIKRKGLIVGCGSGRLVFEMAKHFIAMDGIDTNGDFIGAANLLKTKQMIAWEIANHGDMVDRYKSTAFKDLKCDKTILSKCNFAEIKDYHTIPLSYNKYDCIIILNVLDKLHSPKKFVNSIQRRANKGGILIFSECFDWNESITNKLKWIGGTGNKTSSDALKGMLRMFTLIKEDKMSFIERKNAFSFKLSIANTVILKKN